MQCARQENHSAEYVPERASERAKQGHITLHMAAVTQACVREGKARMDGLEINKTVAPTVRIRRGPPPFFIPFGVSTHELHDCYALLLARLQHSAGRLIWIDRLVCGSSFGLRVMLAPALLYRAEKLRDG
jgi:hypothetical protein